MCCGKRQNSISEGNKEQAGRHLGQGGIWSQDGAKEHVWVLQLCSVLTSVNYVTTKGHKDAMGWTATCGHVGVWGSCRCWGHADLSSQGLDAIQAWVSAKAHVYRNQGLCWSSWLQYVAWGLGCHLRPRGYVRIVMQPGPYRSEWPWVSRSAMMISRSKLQLKVMSVSMFLPQPRSVLMSVGLDAVKEHANAWSQLGQFTCSRMAGNASFDYNTHYPIAEHICVTPR